MLQVDRRQLIVRLANLQDEYSLDDNLQSYTERTSRTKDLIINQIQIKDHCARIFENHSDIENR